MGAISQKTWISNVTSKPMNPEKYLEILQRLIALAQEYQGQYSDVRCYEPAFFAVLMFVRSADANLKDLAELEFVKLIQEPEFKTHELIGYCMRELKFKLVKDDILKLLNNTEDTARYLGRKRILTRLLDAYGDHWDEDQTYSYFRKE
jgi:hypothetical protein